MATKSSPATFKIISSKTRSSGWARYRRNRSADGRGAIPCLPLLASAVQNRFCERRCYLALDRGPVSDRSDWIGGAGDRIEDCIDLRSTVLARNKRDLVAATEIPAVLAISLTDASCNCWISMMLRRTGRKRLIARFKSFSASFFA